MGDVRFEEAYRRLARSRNLRADLARLTDEEVVAALAWVSTRQPDPLLANVLATEAMNRMRRLRVVSAHLAEGVIVTSADERIVHLNDEALRRTGWDPELTLGEPFADCVRPCHADGSPLRNDESPIRHVLRTGRALHVEADVEFRRADGSRFPVAFSAAPVLRDTEIDGAVLVFRDVSERVRFERALRESEERFRALSDNATEGVMIHVGGRVLEANRAALGMMGLSRAEALEGTIFDFLTEESARRVRAAVETEREEPYVVVVRNARGETFPVEIRARSLPYQGLPARVITFRRLDGP